MACFLQEGSAPPGSATFLNSHTVIQETLQIQTTALTLASGVRTGDRSVLTRVRPHEGMKRYLLTVCLINNRKCNHVNISMV